MIKAAIVGYGNIGKAVLEAVSQAKDFELCGIVRRSALNPPPALEGLEVVDDIRKLKEKPDVAILCVPTRSVEAIAKDYLSLGISTVDSFDIHSKIPALRDHSTNPPTRVFESGNILLYLAEKFSYGLLVNVSQAYISPTFSLLLAFLILTVLLAPRVQFVRLLKEKTKGAGLVLAAKIPNTIGLVCENLTAAKSITNYSFIQPIILAALFVIQLIRREETSKRNLAGGILCVAGILLFQVF